MKEIEKKKYPIGPEQYVLYEEIGQGVSASVYRALCVPLDEIVAVKILDFERDNCDLVMPMSPFPLATSNFAVVSCGCHHNEFICLFW